jgi:hypothetical protein
MRYTRRFSIALSTLFAVVVSLTSATSLAASDVGTCHALFSQALHPALNQQIDQALRDDSFRPEKLINVLSTDPEIETLFAAATGLKSIPTIREHTLRVFKVFERQWRFLEEKLPATGMTADARLKKLFRFTVALHDIGKGIAIDIGDRSRQLEYTNVIFREQLRAAGFNESEARLALALIYGPIFGDLADGHMTPELAVKKIREQAKRSRLTPLQYATLRGFFFTCDAASYDWLRAKSFVTESNGEIRPSFPAYAQVIELVTPARE